MTKKIGGIFLFKAASSVPDLLGHAGRQDEDAALVPSKIIFLTQGQSAIVDPDDFKKFGSMKWCAMWHSGGKRFYAGRVRRGPDGKNWTIYLHRAIMQLPPSSMVVDHINHNTLDNRKVNLRVCNQFQNQMNRSGATSRSKSGSRGISQYGKRGKWVAKISVDGESVYLGSFPDKASASTAYAVANKKYYGDFGGGL